MPMQIKSNRHQSLTWARPTRGGKRGEVVLLERFEIFVALRRYGRAIYVSILSLPLSTANSPVLFFFLAGGFHPFPQFKDPSRHFPIITATFAAEKCVGPSRASKPHRQPNRQTRPRIQRACPLRHRAVVAGSLASPPGSAAPERRADRPGELVKGACWRRS